MIKPDDIESEEVWATLAAAASGDVATLRTLIRANPELAREGYFYTPAIHFAVREGHLEAARLLLDAGADPEQNGYYDGSLVEMARDRGHAAIVSLLEERRTRAGLIVPLDPRADHPIHLAAEAGDLGRVRALLDAEPALVNRGDRTGGPPLHRAVLGRARAVVRVLLDRGADVNATHGAGVPTTANHAQAIDLAIWGGPRTVRPPRWRQVIRCARRVLRRRRASEPPRPCDLETVRLLLARGATYDMTIAAALGDIDVVRKSLDADPSRIHEIRPNGRRPLSAAVEFGHDAIVRLLLDRGADPGWPEQGSPRGASLHYASRAGNLPLVELLLAHGADPNSDIDSAGNSTFVAKTPEIRALLMARGGTIDPYDLVWLDEDDEVMRQVTANPQSAQRGCGGVFTAVVTRGKRDLLARLLKAGIRVPPVVTGCQSYLMEQTDMLQTLLAHGMSPDLMNWQHQTLLHMVCRGPDKTGGSVQRAAILLDAGAMISAREDQYRSTPLGWAARTNALEMVKFLLSRGAATNLPDDEPWATPLAWAARRGHDDVHAILVAAGAKG
ncbi:MAG TPA: ankyrin repeat domain-containing protein [Vicinamibacterales bacterium]|nr:ankyrin repeat domain-containing protein [Vicinamibacterales bacterium]